MNVFVCVGVCVCLCLCVLSVKMRRKDRMNSTDFEDEILELIVTETEQLQGIIQSKSIYLLKTTRKTPTFQGQFFRSQQWLAACVWFGIASCGERLLTIYIDYVILSMCFVLGSHIIHPVLNFAGKSHCKDDWRILGVFILKWQVLQESQLNLKSFILTLNCYTRLLPTINNRRTLLRSYVLSIRHTPCYTAVFCMCIRTVFRGIIHDEIFQNEPRYSISALIFVRWTWTNV